MAKFKANMNFRDLEKAIDHQAGKPFEMTVKRSEELIKNIKQNHDVDIVLTRLDVEEEAEKKEIKAKAEPKEKEPEGDK